MRVERLRLVSFRNYRDESVNLSPGLNLVIGANAQGKTNLLEGLYCLGGLGSPRGSDAAMVGDGATSAVVHGEVVRGVRRVNIALELRPGRGSRVLVNNTPSSGLRALRDVVTAVYFGPDDLALVKGSPEMRRRWLDDVAVKLFPAREGVRREWDRVLKQRNALLKSVPRAGSARASAGPTLEVWDEAFCRLGGQVAAARIQTLVALLPYAQKRYEAVAGGGRLELAYRGSWLPESGEDDPETLRQALSKKLAEVGPKEIERGVSLVGPQRDDIEIRLAGKDAEGTLRDARLFASQGDQRTIALGLKIGEFDLLCDLLKDDPVLLLDDVFSELDPARRAWLLESVRRAEQSVITSAEDAPMSGNGRVIRVESGRLVSDG